MEVLVKKEVHPGKVWSFAEQKAAEERIQDLQSQVNSQEIKQGLSFESRDPQTSEKWLNHYQKMKAAMGVTRLEGNERVRGEVEIRRLEQMMAKFWGGSFPSYEEYWMSSRAGMRYLKLRDTIVKVQASREYGALMSRWKTLKRCMEPDDVNADNVLQLFDRRR